MIKIVMKNKKTNEYWCLDCFPPLTKDVWRADKFEREVDARGSVHTLMAEKYSPRDFEPVKITLSEENS